MTIVLVVSTGIVGASAVLRSSSPLADAAVCPGAQAAGATVTSAAVGATSAPTGALPPQLVAQPTRLQLLPVFRQWASVCALPDALVEATCWWESGWQQDVVSTTGAVGVCQIEPDAAQTVRGILGNAALDPHLAVDNIEMSAVYLRWLLDQNGGSRDLALAAYYQGPTSVREHGIMAVSRPYVAGITALLHEYRWS
jgi:soluble lytic murein transglycosylase-like protein